MSPKDQSTPDATDVVTLPAAHGSLAHGVRPTGRATLVARTVDGGITVGPRDGRTILFGRNADEVHVCLGADDRGVSRQHGVLTFQTGRWWLRNTGRSTIRLASGLLFTNDDPVPLADGYTPLFVRGTREREHLLEVYVVSADGDEPRPRPTDDTHSPSIWPLSETEQLALIVLGTRYLLHEANPQPLPWKQAAELLDDLQPGRWTAKRVERMVARVRGRLSQGGVFGLIRDEVQEPIGNTLNDNLLRELVRTGSLVPSDLERLEAES